MLAQSSGLLCRSSCAEGGGRCASSCCFRRRTSTAAAAGLRPSRPARLRLGCTHFIPGSNTQAAHQRLRHGRDAFLSSAEFSRATIGAGAAVVMDSRTCHFGDANESRRRTLLYFTLLSPDFAEAPGAGTKFERTRINLHDYDASKLSPVVALPTTLVH